MTPEQIAELERAMAQENLSPLPLTIVGNDEYAWLKASDGVFVHSPEGMNPDDAKLFAALANACDAGLLDAARKGLEADAEIDQLRETAIGLSNRLYRGIEHWRDGLSRDDLPALQAEADKEGVPVSVNVHGRTAITVQPSELAFVKSQLAAVTAERDDVLNLMLGSVADRASDYVNYTTSRRAYDELKRRAAEIAAARQSQEKTP